MAKGLQHYSVVQAQNAQLGQAGFDIYYNGATPSSVSGKWVALQALGVSANALVLVHAETSIGDNLSDNGTTGEITLQGGGPVLYGPFNKLVSATIAAGSALIAYRG